MSDQKRRHCILFKLLFGLEPPIPAEMAAAAVLESPRRIYPLILAALAGTALVFQTAAARFSLKINPHLKKALATCQHN
jgi:hypothetical protein